MSNGRPQHASDLAGDGPVPAAIATSARRSLLTYSPAIILVVIAVADAGRYADPDLWGHLLFGRGILQSGHLRHVDPYSYSAAGLRWSDHEWLTEVAIAFCYDALGIVGLKIMKLACTAAMIVLLALGEAETGASETVQFPILIAAGVALGPQIQFRPQLFTFIFLAATLWLIARDNYGRRAPLWLMIPMMALWVNFHGGFFIGLAVLATYCAVVIARDLYEGRRLRRGVRLAALMAGTAVATLATPYGFENWRAVIRTLRNPMTHGLVQEWQPLITVMMMNHASGHSALTLYVLILGLMAAFAIAFALSPRGGDLPLAAIAALMIAGAFFSVRNMALAVIAIAGPLARHVHLVLAQWSASPVPRESGAPAGDTIADAATRLPSPRLWWINQFVLTVVAILVLVMTGLFSPRLGEAIGYPAGALAFMRSNGLHGNILNDFNWGEYIIYHTAPGSKVFIDSRYDLVYPPAVVRDYIDFYLGTPGADRMLAAWPHDFVLITPDSPAGKYMARRADWKLIYRDQYSLLFARAGSPAALASSTPVIAKALPSYFP
ncbi:MAG: hypothetical protein IVW54_17400 [Candidatus Binataceae bacterium]|nr:hypothetical protein [Candidatus Binataceae bacterium]